MWKRSKTEGEKLSEEEIKPSEIEDIEGKLKEIETLVLRQEKEKNKTEEKKRKHLEEAEKRRKKITGSHGDKEESGREVGNSEVDTRIKRHKTNQMGF